jgi:phage replication O-like protein O
MAKPQLENGFSRVANEILEALALTKLNMQETRFVFYLLRMTYGWGQTFVPWSNKAFCVGTALSRQNVNTTKRKLKGRKIILEQEGKIRLNKDYEQWLSPDRLHKGVVQTDYTCSPDRLQTVVRVDYKNPRKAKPRKDVRGGKEKKERKDIYSEEFEALWKRYPKRKGKYKAWEAYKSHVLTNRRVTHDTLVELLERQRPAMVKKIKEDGSDKYVKGCSVWINSRPWDDDDNRGDSPQGQYKGPKWLLERLEDRRIVGKERRMYEYQLKLSLEKYAKENKT